MIPVIPTLNPGSDRNIGYTLTGDMGNTSPSSILNP